jgi:hypothetical protein
MTKDLYSPYDYLFIVKKRCSLCWEEIRRSRHFEEHHKGTLAWNDVIRLIYLIKNKRKKGSRIEIEDARFYILCELKGKILYVINVKRKR